MITVLAVKGLKRWLAVNLTDSSQNLKTIGINHTSKYIPDRMLVSLDLEGVGYALLIPSDWHTLRCLAPRLLS